MSNPSLPLVHFREVLDEYLWWEISQKGWYTGAVAELPGGKFYPLTFFDPVRLAQEMEAEVERGKPCLVEQALVVVPKITESAIRASAERLFLQGWFEHLTPSATAAEALHLVGAGL
jgi:hypothetical protein